MRSPDSSVTDVFEHWPEKKTVLTLAVPSIISQLVTTAYSLTDTFFIGRIGSEYDIAAVSVSYTAMIMLNTVANLFGVGGGSLLSRSLGAKDRTKARQAVSFSLWCSVLLSGIYSLLMLLFPAPLARLFGAQESFLHQAEEYLFYAIAVGAVPTVMTMVFSHLIRAEGGAKQAGFGLCLAGVANMILDPLFIFPQGLNMGVAGAALATALSNGLAVMYFLFYMVRRRDSSVLTFHPRWFTARKAVSLDILSVGFPQALKTTMSTISGSVLNHLAAPFGEYAVAAVGIAHKFDQIPMHVSTGFSAGSLPVIGYTFAACRLGRMKRVMKYTLRYSLYTALGFAGIYLLAAQALTRLFISDPLTAQTSARFLRIICVGCPGMAVSFTLTALFQATGRPKEALFLSLYRKGAGDIPLLFLMNWLFPMTGLLMVQPIVDTSAMGIAFLFYRRLAGTLYADSAEEKACTAND